MAKQPAWWLRIWTRRDWARLHKHRASRLPSMNLRPYAIEPIAGLSFRVGDGDNADFVGEFDKDHAIGESG